MRIISYISSIIITFFLHLAIMSGCKDSEVVDDGFRTTMAKASDVKLNKVAYWPGDPVNCSFTLKNETNYPMDIREVKVVIQNLDDGGCVLTEKVCCFPYSNRTGTICSCGCRDTVYPFQLH